MDEEKIPISIDRFGKTSTVSIPLTICDALGQDRALSIKILMSGYGAGLSWGSCITELTNCTVYDVTDI